MADYDARTGIFSRRNRQPLGGGNPHRFIELAGGQEVLMQSYEPDANTARETYYYNTRINVLYKRIDTKDYKRRPKSIWKMVSEC